MEGVERQVFDIGHGLPFGRSIEGTEFDMVESFYVNVPNTNVSYALVRHVWDNRYSYHPSKTDDYRANYRAQTIR